VTVRVLYHREADGCWAESPDIDGWTVARATYEEVRGLVADGLTFAHAAAAEVRGEPFDENRFSAAVVEHFLPAPAQRPTPERDPNFSRPERLAAKNSVDRLPCSR
jgi:predicted RNase H-like HicB family nuclease